MEQDHIDASQPDAIDELCTTLAMAGVTPDVGRRRSTRRETDNQRARTKVAAALLGEDEQRTRSTEMKRLRDGERAKELDLLLEVEATGRKWKVDAILTNARGLPRQAKRVELFGNRQSGHIHVTHAQFVRFRRTRCPQGVDWKERDDACLRQCIS